MEAATRRRDACPGSTAEEAFASRDCWPQLIDYLVNGPDCLVRVDEQWNVLEANGTFSNRIQADWTRGDLCFLDTLTDGSRRELERASLQEPPDGALIHLDHKIPGGSCSLSYSLRACGQSG